MSYTINLTNGTKLTEIIDGSIDQSATDITLIGRNVSNYGTFYNDNLVSILENFANVTAPTRPIIGQLWFDTNAKILKVYNGNGFAPTGNTIVSNSQPTNLASGTLWIDSTNKQLKFYDGVDLITAGPVYTASQGASGFVVRDIIDDALQQHTIVELRVGNVLIGIFSNIAFTPLNAIDGFVGNINPGFNVGSQSDLTFDMEVSRALALVDANGDTQTTDSFVSATSETPFVNGTLSMLNNIPFVLGNSGELQVNVDTEVTQFRSNKINQNFQITTRTGNLTYDPAFFIDAANQRVGIYTDAPTSTLDVAGDMRITGNLIVEGATTTINTNNLVVEDILVEIGKTEFPSDASANNGGISLAGSTPKTITWKLANDAWVSSESFELQGGNKYKINGEIVLTSTSLGLGIVSAPGLNSIGHLSSLAVSWLSISNNTITYSNSPQIDGDIILAPIGAGVVDVSSKKITHVASPQDTTDAANKAYVDNTVKMAPHAITLHIGTITVTDWTSIIATYLNVLFPVEEHVDGAVIRAVCIPDTGPTQIQEYHMISGAWAHYATY
jgi:hypothetical protein